MYKRSIWDIVFEVCTVTGLLIFAFLCFYPMYYVLIYSFSDSATAVSRGVTLLPVGFTFMNYRLIFMSSDVPSAILVSASRAVSGTLITIFFSFMYAYLVTRRDLPMKRFFYRYLIISMYLGAGLIPWYLLMIKLNLQNSFLLYVIPGAIQAFFVILIKTYIEQLPASLEESAQIDGAGPMTIMIRIMMPLCLPVIATIAVFSAVGQWNSWQDNFFLVSKAKLKTLQLLLLEYLQNNSANVTLQGASARSFAQINKVKLTSSSIRATMTVIALLPIITVYPMMQRYFVKGILLGAVKG